MPPRPLGRSASSPRRRRDPMQRLRRLRATGGAGLIPPIVPWKKPPLALAWASDWSATVVSTPPWPGMRAWTLAGGAGFDGAVTGATLLPKPCTPCTPLTATWERRFGRVPSDARACRGAAAGRILDIPRIADATRGPPPKGRRNFDEPFRTAFPRTIRVVAAASPRPRATLFTRTIRVVAAASPRPDATSRRLRATGGAGLNPDMKLSGSLETSPVGAPMTHGSIGFHEYVSRPSSIKHATSVVQVLVVAPRVWHSPIGGDAVRPALTYRAPARESRLHPRESVVLTTRSRGRALGRGVDASFFSRTPHLAVRRRRSARHVCDLCVRGLNLRVTSARRLAFCGRFLRGGGPRRRRTARGRPSLRPRAA